MILLIYEILLFLIISFSYFYSNYFMEIHFGILALIFGMFTATLFIYYMLLYKSPEYNDKKID